MRHGWRGNAVRKVKGLRSSRSEIDREGPELRCFLATCGAFAWHTSRGTNMDSTQAKLKVLRMRPGSEVNPDYFLMALTINSRTTAPTVAITNWPINP
jgi:hypothetical protein